MPAETLLDGAARIVAPGIPKPWRRTGYNRSTGARFLTKQDKLDRQPVQFAWREAGGANFGFGDVAMAIEFVFPRSKSHYGTGRNAHLVKASAPRYPGKNLGDLDNLVKLIKDALNGIAYHDDSQISTLTASKRFAATGEQPHTVVAIRPI